MVILLDDLMGYLAGMSSMSGWIQFDAVARFFDTSRKVFCFCLGVVSAVWIIDRDDMVELWRRHTHTIAKIT